MQRKVRNLRDSFKILLLYFLVALTIRSYITLDTVKEELPLIFIITPTYRRLVQMAELTRLAQTLRYVPSIHWIVVEDSDELSSEVAVTLQRLAISHTHLCARMPKKYRNMEPFKPRGVSNRNAALKWIRSNAKTGVFYFADDDNTYDIRLFMEMRYTKKVSMWPVGLIGSYGVSSPIVNMSNGNVIDFLNEWIGGRKFPVDMASFAVNVEYFLRYPDAMMPFIPGYEEEDFLKSLNLSLNDIEPKANYCSEILVWHTQTRNNMDLEEFPSGNYNGTNYDILKLQLRSFQQQKKDLNHDEENTRRPTSV